MAQDPKRWMWAEAIAMLAQAEQLHRQFFHPIATSDHPTVWEPPVDMIETDHEVLVLAALPGVDPDQCEARIDQGMLVIAGQRALPAALRNALIHRLELPQGRFLRRVPLPPGRYDAVRHSMINGCLVINLSKAEMTR